MHSLGASNDRNIQSCQGQAGQTRRSVLGRAAGSDPQPIEGQRCPELARWVVELGLGDVHAAMPRQAMLLSEGESVK
jgi:hypothetical protein